MNSATSFVGYVTASICWQPIHPGLKKSRNRGFLVLSAEDNAAFMSLSHLTGLSMVCLLRCRYGFDLTIGYRPVGGNGGKVGGKWEDASTGPTG